MAEFGHRAAGAAVRSLVFVTIITGAIAGAAIPAFADWDVIAVDDDTDTKGGNAGYGVGTGETKAEAKRAALAKCEEAGNGGCQAVLAYEEACGAYASSRKHAGTGTGSTKKAAEARALDECGSEACQVVVSDCVESE